jgi:hypothetical protein
MRAEDNHSASVSKEKRADMDSETKGRPYFFSPVREGKERGKIIGQRFLQALFSGIFLIYSGEDLETASD